MRKRISVVMLFLTVLVSITGMVLSTMFSKSQEIFPRLNDKNYHFGSYHEDIDDNWSEVQLDTSSGEMQMTYVLSKATRTPFAAGFINRLDTVESLATFHDFNSLRIDLKSNVGMRIPLMITLDYEEGAKKPNGKPFPMLTLSTVIEYEEEGTYIVSFDEMQIPDWWFRVHRLHRDEVDIDKITKVRGVVVGSCLILKEKLQDTITVKKIEFFTDHNDKIQKVFIVACVIVFAMLFVFFFSIAPKRD